MANLYCDFGMLGQVNGEYANREYVVPMATHEGALLASYSRGAKARTRSPSTKQYREREGRPEGPTSIYYAQTQHATTLLSNVSG